MTDHNAHVRDYEWRLRGWRPDARHHEAPPTPEAAAPSEQLPAFADALCRPLSMSRKALRREWVDRRVCRMSEEQLGGPPVFPRPTGKVGRPATKCEYDHAADEVVKLLGARARDQFQREDLPELGRQSGYLARPRLMDIIRAVASDATLTQPRKAVRDRCDAAGEPYPSDSTIKRLLQAVRAEQQAAD